LRSTGSGGRASAGFDAFGVGEADGDVDGGVTGTDADGPGDPGRDAWGDVVGDGDVVREAGPPDPVAVRGPVGPVAEGPEVPGPPDPPDPVGAGAGAVCERGPGVGLAPG
jgi:hypothetical protein